MSLFTGFKFSLFSSLLIFFNSFCLALFTDAKLLSLVSISSLKALETVSFFCLLFIFRTLLEVGNQDSINLVFSFNEVISIIIFYITTGILWSKFLISNYGGNFGDYFYNWSYSKIGKYIPSGFITISVRLNQTFPKNKNSKKLIFGLLEEQFLIPLVGIPSLILSLFFENDLQIYLVFISSLLVIFLGVKYIYSSTKTEFLFLFTLKK